MVESLWKINDKYYDLTSFLQQHPGGAEIIKMARDIRIDDCTSAFEAHHINFLLASKQLNRYEVKLDDNTINKIYENQRLNKKYNAEWLNQPIASDEILHTRFSNRNSFYYEVREEVHKYLKTNNLKNEPTLLYWFVWWFTCAFVIMAYILQMWNKSLWLLLLTDFGLLVLGGYGHNWIHIPRYRKYAYALDWMGLYSYSWLKFHLLEHHIYTNTAKDPHVTGTDPWLLSDPRRKRNFFHKYLTWLFCPIILCFGIYGNYLANVTLIFTKKQEFTWGILLYPIHLLLHIYICEYDCLNALFRWLLLSSVSSCYYFTIALMNHNQHEIWDLQKISNAKDWGIFQLSTSCDIGYNYNFLQSMLCLWLNYHTVHHLFPTLDMSHHANVQHILNRVARKHNVSYHYKPFFTMYYDMIKHFSLQKTLQIIKQGN